jgi:hypothetical protein
MDPHESERLSFVTGLVITCAAAPLSVKIYKKGSATGTPAGVLTGVVVAGKKEWAYSGGVHPQHSYHAMATCATCGYSVTTPDVLVPLNASVTLPKITFESLCPKLPPPPLVPAPLDSPARRATKK